MQWMRDEAYSSKGEDGNPEDFRLLLINQVEKRYESILKRLEVEVTL